MNNASKLPETDLCVMCGMCLPQCPTYQLYQCETESPRGRIALMQAIDQQRIKADAKALLHIDHCLSCLNCETICPSQVPYGKLIDEFRNLFRPSIRKPIFSKLILRQASKANGIKKLVSISHIPVLKQLIQLPGMPDSLSSNASDTAPASLATFHKGDYSTSDSRRGEVTLFTGCSGETFDHRSFADAIIILKRLKFDVHVPSEQPCCGALHQHNGQKETAKQLLNECQQHTLQTQTPTLLFFSPACGDRLKQLNNSKAVDVRTFIFNELRHHPLEFSAFDRAIALHESCSHRNMLKLKNLNIDLLNCIPNLLIIESSNPSLCCGAAGIQSINYPKQAQALLQGKLKSFDLTQASILISDNIGCSLHIKSAIYGYNSDIEILHPVSFLARQLLADNLQT